MKKQKVIEAILDIAQKGNDDRLLEMTVASSKESLYEASIEHFGGWDAALAKALCEAESSSSAGTTTDHEEQITRRISDAAKKPLYGTTENGLVFKMPGLELEVTDTPEYFPTPPGSGHVNHLYQPGDVEGLVVFTNTGRYFSVQEMRIPKRKGDNVIKEMNSILNLEPGEVIEFILPKRALFGGRLIHITRNGKGKASDTVDFPYALDREGRTAFYLNDDDEPVNVLVASKDVGIFCASSYGRGIHFPADELRSMGRKAVGVNVMKLDEPDNKIVGAFVGKHVKNVAVLTTNGYGKRVEFSEFRQQGRAGAGMQLLRLNREDKVAGVAACRPAQDLAIMTTKGRIHRRPASDFKLMGRPAKGNRVFDFADDEKLLGFTALPCGSDSN